MQMAALFHRLAGQPRSKMDRRSGRFGETIAGTDAVAADAFENRHLVAAANFLQKTAAMTESC